MTFSDDKRRKDPKRAVGSMEEVNNDYQSNRNKSKILLYPESQHTQQVVCRTMLNNGVFIVWGGPQ